MIGEGKSKKKPLMGILAEKRIWTIHYDGRKACLRLGDGEVVIDFMHIWTYKEFNSVFGGDMPMIKLTGENQNTVCIMSGEHNEISNLKENWNLVTPVHTGEDMP